MVNARLWPIACALLALSSARADWQVRSQERTPGPSEAVEHRHYSLGESDSAERVTVELALFSAAKGRLRVIDQPDFANDLAEVMTKNNCIAGVNGGYFDPQGAPVGLLRSDGKEISAFRRARLLSGVLAVDAAGVKIFRAGEFPRERAWRDAVQCGPFLIDHGQPIAGLDDTRSARRTFVATTSDRRAALGFCESVTLAQLARVIAALPDLKIKRALNLDGGSSSAFWCRTAEGTISISERKQVRDFVALVPSASR